MAEPKKPSEQKPETFTGLKDYIHTGEEPAVKMVVKTISTTYERKFNLGEYESANLGVTTWADIEPEQDPAAAINELQELCKEQVRKQALPILRGRKNGGFEYSELQDNYQILERIVDDALAEVNQHGSELTYKGLVERLNALKNAGT